MQDDARYKINAPKVISELIDGEVVIINLDQGNYYSLAKLGGDIWQHIQLGASVGDVMDHVVKVYDGEENAMREALQHFFTTLENENLIVMNDAEPAELMPASELPADKKPFLPPVLNKYTDMQDLLLLDPIHEVDDKGWPSAKP